MAMMTKTRKKDKVASVTRMKVAILIASDNSGGLGKYVIDLGNRLASQCETYFIGNETFRAALQSDVDFTALDARRAGWNPLFLWRLYQALKRGSPQIIHAHGNAAVRALAMIKPLLDAKCIGTVHWHITRRRECRPYERLDGVIGVSNEVIRQIRAPLNTAIYNGVSPLDGATPPLTREQLGVGADEKLVLAIGRLVKGKGFDVLLHAVAPLQARLLLVGSGPELPVLQRLAAELGIARKVIFAGHVDNAARLMPLADLVTIASRREGFSYVLAEALLNGVPVISTRVSGPVELLPTQLLVDTGDADALGKLMAEALADPDVVRLALRERFAWARQHLTLDAMVASNLAFYQRVLAR